MTWKEKCEKLENRPDLNNFFEVLCTERKNTYAVWLEGDTKKTYDFEYFYNTVYSTAGNIIKLNFGEQDGWVAISFDTCKEWPIIFWALLAAGRKTVLLDPSLNDLQTANIMRQAGTKSIVTRKHRKIICDQKTPDELLVEGKTKVTTKWADEIAVCTSGTTETSRVFVYDGKAICAQSVGFMHHQVWPCFTCEEEGAVMALDFLPLNHVFGILTNVICTPMQGCPQVFLKDRAPQTILDTCRKCHVQLVMCVPLLANGIADKVKKEIEAQPPFKRTLVHIMQSFSLFCQKINPRWGLKVGKKMFKSINDKLFGNDLNQIVIGGAHIPEEYQRVLSSLGYAVTIGYGMTETAITSYNNKLDLKSRMSSSVGLPLPISEYKLNHLQDDDDSSRGELLIRCKAMHIGRMVNGKMVPPDVDSEGFFATGDVVKLGKGNRMWIEGRVKDVIIGPSGENVYPDELEDVFAHITGISQMTVLGTKKGNEEMITLVLVPDTENASKEKIADYYNQFKTLNETLRTNLKVKRVLMTNKKLPVAATIKIRRLELQKQIESDDGTVFAELDENTSKIPVVKSDNVQESDTAEDIDLDSNVEKKEEKPKVERTTETDSEDIKKFKEIVRDCVSKSLMIEKDKIGDDDDFFSDLGGDSLSSMDTALGIEEESGIKLPESSYKECTTVTKIANILLQLKYGEYVEPTDDSNAENDIKL